LDRVFRVTTRLRRDYAERRRDYVPGSLSNATRFSLIAGMFRRSRSVH
jgi:hypothetical protein